ncbi:MAG: hypothetical protein WDW38_005024 [Sanguina aurantia]
MRGDGEAAYSSDARDTGYSEQAGLPLPPVSFYVPCHPGLEKVVADELREMGAECVTPGKTGVSFRGHTLSDGYRANLGLRSAIRVMVLLAEGHLDTDVLRGRRGGQALYDLVRSTVAWEEVIPPRSTFSVEPRLWSCTDIHSTALVWGRVKDAVCDSLRDARSDKPPPPQAGSVADVPLFVALYEDQVSIYRDMSGASLHRRGYRAAMHKASLNESAAAGVLRLAGWHKTLELEGGWLPIFRCRDWERAPQAQPREARRMSEDGARRSATSLGGAAAAGLWLHARSGHCISCMGSSRDLRSTTQRPAHCPDPPPPCGCGPRCRDTPVSRHRADCSYTALLTMQGARRSWPGGSPPGLMRAPTSWPFTKWPDHSAKDWATELDAAQGQIRHWRGKLIGSDMHPGSIALAEGCAQRAGVADLVSVTLSDCASFTPTSRPTMVVTNPPWGSRLMAPQGRERSFRPMTPAPAPAGRSGPVRPDDDSWQPGAAANAGPRTVPRPAQSNERLHRSDTERHSRETDSSGGEEPEVGAESRQELERTWGSLDRFLYTKCRGASAHVLSGNLAVLKTIKLQTTARHVLSLSGVDCRMHSFQIRDLLANSTFTEPHGSRQPDTQEKAHSFASQEQR